MKRLGPNWIRPRQEVGHLAGIRCVMGFVVWFVERRCGRPDIITVRVNIVLLSENNSHLLTNQIPAFACSSL